MTNKRKPANENREYDPVAILIWTGIALSSFGMGFAFVYFAGEIVKWIVSVL